MVWASATEVKTGTDVFAGVGDGPVVAVREGGGVGVRVGVDVVVGVRVFVGVTELVGDGPGVGVRVRVGVDVRVAVGVDVRVGVDVAEGVGVRVRVGVAVEVAVAVRVGVFEGVGVIDGVGVVDGFGVMVGVFVLVGPGVGVLTVGLGVNVAVACSGRAEFAAAAGQVSQIVATARLRATTIASPQTMRPSKRLKRLANANMLLPPLVDDKCPCGVSECWSRAGAKSSGRVRRTQIFYGFARDTSYFARIQWTADMLNSR